MPDPSREDVVAAFFAAMNAHDGDAAAALVDPTVEIALGNHIFAGQHAVRELATQRDPQLEFETIPLSFAGAGDQVEVTARRVQRWRTSGEIASEDDVHARFVLARGVITHVSLT